MSAVRIKNISKSYVANGKTIHTLRLVNLDIADGELFCVAGHSGCGKTTCLNILARFIDPTEGTVSLDTNKPLISSNSNIGVIFQEDAFPSWRTALENTMFGPEVKGNDSRENKAIAPRFLELICLSDSTDIYPHQLSGGDSTACCRSLGPGLRPCPGAKFSPSGLE